ncbi:MAG: molybdate ABC transporter substrate-binding protein [Candidatus Eremiobacterota bacterium]
MTYSKSTFLLIFFVALSVLFFLQNYEHIIAGSSVKTITVFAASSLTDPFRETGKSFEDKNPGVRVVFNFAGSQKLLAQLKEGAKGDVFVSAGPEEINECVKNSLIVPEKTKIFAGNHLIIVFPRDNPGKITDISDLTGKGLKIVMADISVPAGRYTVKSLELMEKSSRKGFKDKVLKNVVSREENVKAVMTKLLLGEGDAGFVYVSDVDFKSNKTGTIKIPDKFNVAISYPAVSLKHAKNMELADKFVKFLLSEECQTILKRYNFIPLDK